MAKKTSREKKKKQGKLKKKREAKATKQASPLPLKAFEKVATSAR